MAGAPNKATMPPRSNMPVFGTYTGNQASMFLEKANPGLRRSTPDSEALASSDEELENSRLKSVANARGSIKPVRRTFSLADHPSPGRKPSMTASGTYSPSTSNPATPSADQNPWPSMSPSAGAWGSASAYPFTSSIWSQDSRKDPPSRLQEMHASESQEGIPFSIPLQPTPKTYRSQSYSVGQLEPGTGNTGAPAAPATIDPPRIRAGGQISSLQRRTSRQGIMSSGTVANLGGLREVDDDEDPLDSTQTKVDQAREIERLEMENAQLRAAQSRERTLSSTSAMHMAPAFRNTRIRGVVPEETDLAIDDNDDLGGQYPQRSLTRRFSEQVAQYPDRQPLAPGDSRNARWQTTLGFGRLADIPQSRRHSFADVPTRHGSSSSHGKIGHAGLLWNLLANRAEDLEDPDAFEAEQRGYGKIDERKSTLPLIMHKPTAPFYAMSYSSNPLAQARGQLMASAPRTVLLKGATSLHKETILALPSQTRNFTENQGSPFYHPLAIYFQVDENRRREAEASVQKGIAYANPYGIPSNMGTYQGPGQSFFIVNFKCCRSDIFYIQEGTGLQVQVGDLVIVDADRGTDLGAVQHCHVTLEEARRYKEYYAEEHYKLLMMFSQQTKNGGMNAVNPNGPSGRQSAVGGMGPQGHGHRDPHGDPKAKMIKRLAQTHEIQALKEKEGNEAKAKRVCSQKVVEHSLNMEILDAEFQMDSKKLTFYYFADEYINFNSLVTDLFKIYKTRIWMSAINPASFQTPTSSLGLTPAFGNPAFGAPAPPPQNETPRRNVYNMGNTMGYQFEDARVVSRGGMPPPFYPQYQSSPSMSQRMGAGLGGYAPAMQPPIDPFSAYPAPNFGMFGQGQTYSRQDVRGHGQSPNTHQSLMSEFQNMSMS